LLRTTVAESLTLSEETRADKATLRQAGALDRPV
jgi:hypothetical protein